MRDTYFPMSFLVCSTENDILIKLAPSFEPDHLLQNPKCLPSCKITIKCKILLITYNLSDSLSGFVCELPSYHKKRLYDYSRVSNKHPRHLCG